jgi:hypothetical protein
MGSDGDSESASIDFASAIGDSSGLLSANSGIVAFWTAHGGVGSACPSNGAEVDLEFECAIGNGWDVLVIGIGWSGATHDVLGSSAFSNFALDKTKGHLHGVCICEARDGTSDLGGNLIAFFDNVDSSERNVALDGFR